MRLSIFLLFILTTSAHAEFFENLDYQSYSVSDDGEQTLLAALNAASPIRQDGHTFHAYTKWNVKWQFWWNSGADGACTISTVKTTATGTITLPELISTDSAMLAKFAEYSAALRVHESGHFKFATDAAHEIEQKIQSLPTMENCAALELEANRVGYEILETFKVSEKTYDRDTEHGKSQGAWLSSN